MQDTKPTSWIEHLEVTGPIKSIMGFVDELSLNYDRRVAAMHAEYQKDIEEIIDCYKEEKHDFEAQLANCEQIITELKKERLTMMQNVKILEVEHNITKDSLNNAKQEIIALTQELKKEDELLALAKARIEAANAKIKSDLDAITQKHEPNDSAQTVATPNKTKEFFKSIMEARLSRTVLLKPTQNCDNIQSIENQNRDTFSY